MSVAAFLLEQTSCVKTHSPGGASGNGGFKALSLRFRSSSLQVFGASFNAYCVLKIRSSSLQVFGASFNAYCVLKHGLKTGTMADSTTQANAQQESTQW